MRNSVRIRVSAQLIGGLLGIGSDKKVSGAGMDWEDTANGTISFVIDGRDLPSVAEGATPPTVSIDEVR